MTKINFKSTLSDIIFSVDSIYKALADKLYVSVLGASDLCYPSHFGNVSK
jgi:hypothetical protein